MDDKQRTCTRCRHPRPERMFAFTDVEGADGKSERRFDMFCQDCRSQTQEGRRGTASRASRTATPEQQETRNTRGRAATTANRQLRFRHPAEYKALMLDATKRYPVPEGAGVDERQRVSALRARRVAQWLRAEFTSEYRALVEQAKLDELPQDPRG